MAYEVPNIALNNGVEMPSIGLGVFQTPPDETRGAVAAAPARHPRDAAPTRRTNPHSSRATPSP